MTIATTYALVAGTWAIDPAHSEVGFTVRHLMTKVRGSFREFDGTIEVAEDPAASKATVSIQLASIDTGTKQRDDHVRSGDFLDIDNHPVMTFVSTGIRPDGDGFVLTGDLTVKGVTRSVDLTAEFLGVEEDAYGNTRAGFDATTTIDRKAFGVDTNVPLGGEKLLIGDQVSVQLSVQAVLQK
ncbi:YceI family protein [Actinopolymorpha sp. B9G3]|uniref:YceI family protein n=1 Tax=Actinopolymorpha sp. B9G3 TaxID=3158970 RepID=UPI0032D9960A